MRPAPSTHIGLENLRQRLLRTYPGAHEFTTAERDGWVVAKLTIAHCQLPNDSATGTAGI